MASTRRRRSARVAASLSGHCFGWHALVGERAVGSAWRSSGTRPSTTVSWPSCRSGRSSGPPPWRCWEGLGKVPGVLGDYPRHKQGLVAVHLDCFVPRNDAKRQSGAKRRGCDAQRESLTLFAMTRSDDEKCVPRA